MKLTILLISIAIIAYLYPFFAGADLEAYYNDYGFSFSTVAAKPWTIITSIFMHGSLEHLLSNVLVWLFFGIAIESELGISRYLIIFIGGALVGDLFSFFFYAHDTLFIGASAGVFALIGAGMLVKPLDVSLYPLIIPIPLALLGMAYVVLNVYSLFAAGGGNISYIGHMGGIVVGFAYGFKKAGTKRSLIIVFTTLAVLIAAAYLFYVVL